MARKEMQPAVADRSTAVRKEMAGHGSFLAPARRRRKVRTTLSFIRELREDRGVKVKERLPRTIHIRLPRLSRISSVNATLSLSRMERSVMPARTSRPQTGSSGSDWRPRSAAARSAVHRILRECGGVTAIEYAMISALIALAIVTAVHQLGQTALTQIFNVIASAL
ncbi:MAG TPA: Flp family type IVb pilin [Rhizomicrobium sp.]|nr:Flp family type IVb pilin [Rhizomicrobium sp.]